MKTAILASLLVLTFSCASFGAIELDAFRGSGSARGGGLAPWRVDRIPFPATYGDFDVAISTGGNIADGTISLSHQSSAMEETLVASLGGEVVALGGDQAGLTRSLWLNIDGDADWEFSGSLLSGSFESDPPFNAIAYFEFRIYQRPTATSGSGGTLVENYSESTSSPGVSLVSSVLSGTLTSGHYQVDLISYVNSSIGTLGSIDSSQLVFSISSDMIVSNYTPDDDVPSPGVVPEQDSGLMWIIGSVIAGFMRRYPNSRKSLRPNLGL